MNGPARAASPPSAPVLLAPDHWRAIDFISDLHLNGGEPETVRAWQHYLQTTQADAIFILGDLFDVWVGDDCLLDMPDDGPTAFALEQQCVQTLRTASQGLALFFMHGNRDFLIGNAFAAAGGVRLLADPTVLVFVGQRYLLSHGDALCLDDIDYMQFRAMSRSDAWQRTFLEQSLADRQAMGQSIRAQSMEKKRRGSEYIDLRATAVKQWLRLSQSQTLIHGHTHKPAVHDLGAGLRRVVLSDWNAQSAPPRTEVLRLRREPAQGLATVSLQRIDATRAHLS